MHFKKQTQIKAQSEAKIRVLLFDKASTEILAKYSDYSNIFSVKNAAKLLKNIKINKHAIKLKKGK